MKIVNETSLTYEELGRIIDKVMESQGTFYEGKIDLLKVGFKNDVIKVQIRYLKNYTEWRFYK